MVKIISKIIEFIEKEGRNKLNDITYNYQEKMDKMNKRMDNISQNIEKYKIKYKNLSDQELKNIIRECNEKGEKSDQDKAKLMAIKYILETRK